MHPSIVCGLDFIHTLKNLKVETAMIRHFFTVLCLMLFAGRSLMAASLTGNAGIIPATPPVNVYTSSKGVDYTGVGYLNFDVLLPGKLTPEFTLGNDEDARWTTGDNKFSSNGLVYVYEGKLRKNKSIEKAWVGGLIKGEEDNATFTRDGVLFNNHYERSGLYFGNRSTTSKRLTQSGNYIVDYSITQMWALFQMSGNTRIDSESINNESNRYISDFDVDSYGAVYRPMITVQPVFTINDSLKFIPFVGASAFVSMELSFWENSEWEDVLYGQDCFDGCPDNDFFLNLIPVELFVGFDVEFMVNRSDRISLSSFFTAGGGTDTDSTSELYVIYTRQLD